MTLASNIITYILQVLYDYEYNNLLITMQVLSSGLSNLNAQIATLAYKTLKLASDDTITVKQVN
ncbi:hypothetical protein CPZ13_00565 [Lacticaseibacillus paracasei]|nr:hypothetical protein CPZ14_00575 [Lacticaseibacillus paracasei]PCL35334.1 hypothetical protein CPZ13_00565 [Lacticaseibacillus paracasei]